MMKTLRQQDTLSGNAAFPNNLRQVQETKAAKKCYLLQSAPILPGKRAAGAGACSLLSYGEQVLSSDQNHVQGGE
jgi:hypothetical protein